MALVQTVQGAVQSDQLGVVLARLHRYAEAVEAWEKVTRIEPGGPFAQRARVHARTALDLQHIFDSDAA